MTTQTYQTVAGVLELRFPYPQAMYVQEWFLNGNPILEYDGEFDYIMKRFARLAADTILQLTEGGTPDLSVGVVALIPVEECMKLLPRYEHALEELHQRDAEIVSQWPVARGLIDMMGPARLNLDLLSARIAQ